MTMHEVIIVGGGPAGVSAALFLAHYRPDLTDRVVVLEKEHYPRDKYCAGGIGGRADKLLAKIGVRVDVPSVRIHGMSAAFGAGDLTMREGDIGRVVRRIELDHALALAARARGIRVAEGVRVAGVAWGAPASSQNAEQSAELDTSAGPMRARVVVGADGVGSVVRRAMGLPFGSVRAQAVEVDTEPACDREAARDLLHFDMRDRSYPGYSWDFPTLVGGRELVCRGTYVLQRQGISADAQQILRARMAAMGLDLARYRVKRFAERGLSLDAEIARPGAILVGEAAGIDPMLGEGIPQAIDYGALAGAYLAEKLREGDLRMHDWRRRVTGSRLGLDMLARAAILRRFYFGPHREPIERFVIDRPSFLRAGMQYFGGKRVSRARLMEAAAQGALLAARLAGSSLLRPPLNRGRA